MLIAGGMSTGTSMLEVAMIDVNSWEWLALPAFDPLSESPCRRYGCTLSPFSLPPSSIVSPG